MYLENSKIFLELFVFGQYFDPISSELMRATTWDPIYSVHVWFQIDYRFFFDLVPAPNMAIRRRIVKGTLAPMAKN